MIKDGALSHIKAEPIITSCSDGVVQLYTALDSQKMKEPAEDRDLRVERIGKLIPLIIKHAEGVKIEFCSEHCQDPTKCIGKNPGANPVMAFNELIGKGELRDTIKNIARADILQNTPDDSNSCPYLSDPIDGPVSTLVEDLRRSGPLGDADPIYTDPDPRSGELLVEVIDLDAIQEALEEPEPIAARPHHKRPRRRKPAHSLKGDDQLAFDFTKQLELDLR
jgi:hypothetical protein